MWTKRLSRLALVAMVATAGACGESTAPNLNVDFDAEATLDSYDALDTMFTAPVWQSFQALSGRTPFGAAAGVSAVVSLDEGSSRDFVITLLAGVSEATSGPATTPVISAGHLGKTFVYNETTDDYQVDEAREGAPANGVRFVIYEVNILGQPKPDQEVGYADLVDNGATSAEDISLSLTVVEDEETVLQYDVTLDDNGTEGALSLDGFLVARGDRLDFEISATTNEVGTDTFLDLDFELSVDALDFSIFGGFEGIEDDEDGDGEIAIAVQSGTDMLSLEAVGTDGQIDGTLLANGAVFATISGDADNPTILSGDGDALTLVETLVLLRILDSVEDVFDFLEDLLDPVGEIVFLAIIL